jgi:hypothetical protein
MMDGDMSENKISVLKDHWNTMGVVSTLCAGIAAGSLSQPTFDQLQTDEHFDYRSPLVQVFSITLSVSLISAMVSVLCSTILAAQLNLVCEDADDVRWFIDSFQNLLGVPDVSHADDILLCAFFFFLSRACYSHE